MSIEGGRAGGADGGGRARLFPAARPLPTLSSPCRCAGRPPGRMERAANGAIVAPLPPDATKAARRAGDGCRSRHPDDPQASPARRHIARQGRYDGHQRVLGGSRARRRDAADVSPLRRRALTRQGRRDSHQRVRGRCHAWRQDAPNTSRWQRRAGRWAARSGARHCAACEGVKKGQSRRVGVDRLLRHHGAAKADPRPCGETPPLSSWHVEF